MAKEEISHCGWRIDLMPHGAGWKAFIYAPGAILSETLIPHGPVRNTVIAEAKNYINQNLGPKS
jgi:hypothetical protein